MKIIDFGLGIDMNSSREMMRDVCGTPGYMAPELCYKNQICLSEMDLYRKKSDTFGIGAILFELLTNKHLFSEKSRTKTIMNNFMCILNFPVSPALSNDQITLLRGLLERDPNKRFSAKEALNANIYKEEDYNQTREFPDIGRNQIRN